MHSTTTFSFVMILCILLATTTSLPTQNKTAAVFAHKNVLLVAPLKKNSIATNTTSAPIDLPEELELGSAERKTTNSAGAFAEYSYEIETDSHEDLIRNILCFEESGAHRPLLYDAAANKCSSLGERGHCGENMIFLPEINSTIFGYCECNSMKLRQPLVYHNNTKMCYPVYSQAYCPKGQWLIFNKASQPVCERSLCESGKTKVKKVPLNGNGACVKLNVASKHCSSNEQIVLFELDRPIPTCGTPVKLPSPRLLSPVSYQRCWPGSYASVTGKCRGTWSW